MAGQQAGSRGWIHGIRIRSFHSTFQEKSMITQTKTQRQKPGQCGNVFDEISIHLKRLNDCLIADLTDRSSRQLEKVSSLLDSLPLNTDDYHLARRRLSSCLRYIRVNEIGAAKYELGLFQRQLEANPDLQTESKQTLPRIRGI